MSAYRNYPPYYRSHRRKKDNSVVFKERKGRGGNRIFIREGGPVVCYLTVHGVIQGVKCYTKSVPGLRATRCVMVSRQEAIAIPLADIISVHFPFPGDEERARKPHTWTP